MQDDVTEEIMIATYRALCKSGYADLTMQEIADHSDKSKATLHYHYDTKRSLLLSFLTYLFEGFIGHVGDPEGDSARSKLIWLIDQVLYPPTNSDLTDHEAFGTAILELKAQAPYDSEIRDRMEQFDEFLITLIRDQIEIGIEQDEFMSVNSEDVAQFIVTAIDGARTKQVTVGQDLECSRRVLHAFIDSLRRANHETKRNLMRESE